MCGCTCSMVTYVLHLKSKTTKCGCWCRHLVWLYVSSHFMWFWLYIQTTDCGSVWIWQTSVVVCLWMSNQYVCTFVDVEPFSMVVRLCQTTKHGSTFVDVTTKCGMLVKATWYDCISVVGWILVKYLHHSKGPHGGPHSLHLPCTIYSPCSLLANHLGISLFVLYFSYIVKLWYFCQENGSINCAAAATKI